MPNKSPSSKRKILTATILSVLLVSALAVSLFVNQAVANPIGLPSGSGTPSAPIVEVIKLDTDTLTLTVLVRAIQASYIEVFVDGKIWSRLGWVAKPVSVSLEGLSNGWHTLKVTATADSGGVNEMQLGGGPRFISQGSSGVIEFQVDTPPPSVQIQSLENTAIHESEIQFALRVYGRTLSWVGYSLDGKENVTVYQEVLAKSSLTSYDEVWKDNLTLAGLSSGSHSLVVYAKDQTGNTGASTTKEFTVEESMVAQEAQAAALPTILTATAIIASAAIVSSVLVAYFLRRKRKRIQE